MRCSPLVLLLLPILAGCATVRSEYTPATGEKLSVYDKAVARTGVERSRAGEDEIRDATGRVVATNTRYTDKEVHWTEHDWYGMQGGVRIDDESFFRIAGDDKTVEAYKTYHQDGSSRATGAGIVAGIGLGLVGAGIAGYVLDPPKEDPVTFHTKGGGFRTLGAVSMGLGGFTTVFALVALFSGRSKAAATDERLVDDPQHARAAAQRYNARLAPAAEDTPAPRSAAVAPPVNPAVDGNQIAQQLDSTTPADCRSYVVRGCDATHGSRDQREAACDKLVVAARKAAATRAPGRACTTLLHSLPK
jgi:hypothetical protein